MKIKDVKQANISEDKLVEIFRKVFQDDKDKYESKVKKWLAKKGVYGSELDDLESDMFVLFMKCIRKEYNHDKIKFEVFVWQQFKFELYNFFQSKKLKKNAIKSSMDSVSNYISKDRNELSDLNMDFDDLVYKYLNPDQAFIARCLFYSGWSKGEITEYKMWSKNYFTEQFKGVIQLFGKYFSNEL